MAESTVGPATDRSEEDAQKRFAAEIRDARRLLDYAVETGWAGSDGRRLEDALILTIKETEEAAQKGEPVAVAQRAKFERAYLDLAALLAPVTARSLADTSTDPRDWRRAGLLTLTGGASEATIWSRKLTLWTLLFLVLALCGEIAEQLWGAASERRLDPAASGWIDLLVVVHAALGIAVPFTYGGLGACAFLLRSLHEYIYKRTFDGNRRAEYYNRILLGFVSGGAVTLFVVEIPDGADASTAVQLSAKALGFLAGYNTDFLFSTLERLAAAILPKVGLETARREIPARPPAAPVAIHDVSMASLLDRYDRATDPGEKALFKTLLERIGARI
jgi:hypothetical protein